MPCQKNANLEGILYRRTKTEILRYDLYKNSHLLHSVPVEIEVRIGSKYCLMVVLKGD